MADDEVPDLFYHYTSKNGLLGILSSGKIWMSDPRFVNDSKEWQHGGMKVANTVRQVAEKYKADWLACGCKEIEFDQFVRNMIKNFERVTINDLFYNTYMFSLSENEDALSQWRAYGRGEYCIAFRPEKLAELTRSKLFRVDYTDDGPDSDLVADFEKLFTENMKFIGKTGSLHPEFKGETTPNFDSRLKRNYYFARLKDKGFVEEKEWRLVQMIAPTSKSVIVPRSQNHYPVPYAVVEIKEWPKTANEVIAQIICGPGIDADRARFGVETMSSVYKFPQFRIRESKIPYRQH